jgi:serine/threonine protein kinase
MPSSGHPSSLGAGRYQVKRLLGEGGRKRVYLAHDTRLDRDVAIEATTEPEGRAKVRIENEIRPSPRTQPPALRDAPAGLRWSAY